MSDPLRLRRARQELFMAMDQVQYGGSQQNVVDAVEELAMALITEAFAKHPITKGAFERTPDSAD